MEDVVCFRGTDGGGALLLAITVLSITKIIPFSQPYLPSTLTFFLDDDEEGWGGDGGKGWEVNTQSDVGWCGGILS